MAGNKTSLQSPKQSWITGGDQLSKRRRSPSSQQW